MTPAELAAPLSELLAFLEARLALPDAAEKDVPLLWRPPEGPTGEYPVRTLALALEWSPALAERAAGHDALFLHRPFDLPPGAFPGVPVLASHRGLDAHLTTGHNPALAAALGLTGVTPHYRPDRPADPVPIGMTGTLADAPTRAAFTDRVTAAFGGHDAVLPAGDPAAPCHRAAVMNALNPALVALAADAGCTAYVTGQLRENARAAALAAGITVIAVGHARTEWWGLRRLAAELRLAFPGLSVEVLA